MPTICSSVNLDRFIARILFQRTGQPQSEDFPGEQVNDDEQSKLFIEKAREIEADEDQSIADELMKRLAKMPPAPCKTGG